MRNYTTKSTLIAKMDRMGFTRYKLAQAVMPGHPYVVLDAMEAACDTPQGLTFTNALR